MQSIYINDRSNPDLPDGRTLHLGQVTVDLDFSEPELRFPHHVCDHIKKEFGLSWNNSMGRYTVDDIRHQELIRSNAKLGFELISDKGVHQPYFVPYESLVVNATPPAVREPTRYIAISRSGGEEYNFGRVFFQEHAITVHYDKLGGSTVRLNQATYNPNTSPQIQEIDSGRLPHLFGSHHGDYKIGVILPVVFCGLAIIAITAYLVWAHKVGWIPFRNKQNEEKENSELENATAWGGDRKEAPSQFPNRQSNAESVYYEAQSEINHDDPLEGSSQPPPRYSVAVAEAQREDAGRKERTQKPA
jgi:hypothetical protein